MGCCQWLGMQYHLRRWQEKYHELLGLGDRKCKLCTKPGQERFPVGQPLEFDGMTQRASKVP